MMSDGGEGQETRADHACHEQFTNKSQWRMLLYNNMNLSDVEAQLKQLPPEALSATLAQHLAQIDKLEESNEEMASLLRNAPRSHAQQRGTDVKDLDIVLDDDDVSELRTACHENAGVLYVAYLFLFCSPFDPIFRQRKKNLATSMYNILLERLGSEQNISADIVSHMARVKQDNGNTPTDVNTILDDGIHL